jgi:hypothetical protein
MMFQQGHFGKLIRKSRRSQYFFSGEKLAFLDSLSKGENMDSYYFCNTVLEGVKAVALAGTRKATLREFHIHLDNFRVHH